MRKNGKLILLATVGVLAVGLILAIGRIIPPINNLLSEELSVLLVANIALKVAFVAIPLILLVKGKTHKQWQEANPDTPITKKNFSTAIYLEMFLFTFIGFFLIVVIWAIAGLIDPDIAEPLLSVYVFGIGEGFLWVWMMTVLVYTLQFTPLVKIVDGIVLLLASFLGSLHIIAEFLQPLSWNYIDYEGVPIPLVIGIYILVGLLLLIIGRTITAKLYEKVDL
jgi:hypothetical protein